METRTTKIYFRVGSEGGEPSCTAISDDDLENGTSLGCGHVDESAPYRDYEIEVTVPVLPDEHESTPVGHVTVPEDMVLAAADGVPAVTISQPAPVS